MCIERRIRNHKHKTRFLIEWTAKKKRKPRIQRRQRIKRRRTRAHHFSNKITIELRSLKWKPFFFAKCNWKGWFMIWMMESKIIRKPLNSKWKSDPIIAFIENFHFPFKSEVISFAFIDGIQTTLNPVVVSGYLPNQFHFKTQKI